MQRLHQPIGKTRVTGRIGMHAVGAQACVGQHGRPATGMQRNLQRLGCLCIHLVVAQLARSGHERQAGHSHQQHLRAAGTRLLANAAKVGARGFERQAPQKVIAADAHDHQRGPVFLQQGGQPLQRLGRGVA